MRLGNSPAGCFQQKAVSRVLKCRAFRSASHPYARRSRSRRRIPSGVPKASGNFCCLRLFIITAHRKGFEQGGRMRSIRKKTARRAVFAAVGNERSEAIAAADAESLPAYQKYQSNTCCSGIFMDTDRRKFLRSMELPYIM